MVGEGTGGAGAVSSIFGSATSATGADGSTGGTSSATVGGTELISATGGGGGTGGSGVANVQSGGSATAGVNETTERGQGAGADGAKGSTNITAANTINSLDTNAGDDAQNGSGAVGSRTAQLAFTPNEAGGTGGAGAQPGGSAGGNGATSNSGLTGQNGSGAVGSIVLVFQSTSSTALTVTGGTDVVVLGGAEEFSPFFNFGTTDHSRQEVIRRINFREFGANNQFATLGDTGVDKAFTLDDGTTTLVAGSIVHEATINSTDYLSIGADSGGQSANNFTLTFVGTGLDVFYIVGGANATRSLIEVFVDGLSISTFDGGDNAFGIRPIVSGLAYGTHTVRFQALTESQNEQGVSDFIIYGPKKPEIPTLDAGSLELSDYNVVADYTANSTAGLNTIGKGILRKEQIREFLYTGTVTNSGASAAHVGGYNIETTGTTGRSIYTFYGTGFDMRFVLDGGGNATLSLDGSTDFSGFTTSFYIAAPNTTATFTASTGVMNNPDTGNGTGTGSGISVSGLTLGVHTIQVTHNSGNPWHQGPIDVITPIHINEDTLKLGSEGLNNLTIDPIVEEDEAQVNNLGEAKAWVYFDDTDDTIKGSYNIASVIKVSDTEHEIFFDKPFKDANYIGLVTGSNSAASTQRIIGVNNARKFPNAVRISNSAALNAYYAVFYGELIDE